MASLTHARVTVQPTSKRRTPHTYTVILGTAPDTALVSSRSNEAEMHTVTGDTCDCTAFQFYGDCAHLRAVAQYWQAQRQAVAS